MAGIARNVKHAVERMTGRHVLRLHKWPYVYMGLRRFLLLRMDTTNKCNLRCRMCHFGSEESRRAATHIMDPEKFSIVADKVFSRVCHLALSCGAEPLINKDFASILEITAAHGVPQVEYLTNGLLLDSDIVGATVKAGVDHVTVSVDGATKLTYESIREGSSYERVLGNVQNLIEMRDKLGRTRPRVSFNVVLMRENIEELPQVVHMASRLGVCMVSCVHLSPYERLNMHQSSLWYDKDLGNRMLDEARDTAAELGLMFNCPPNFSLETKELGGETKAGRQRHPDGASRCRLPWNSMRVEADGNVLPCGWWYEMTPMGNIFRQSFEEIWKGEPYKQLRKEHKTSRFRKTCGNCPAAGFGSVDDEKAFSEK